MREDSKRNILNDFLNIAIIVLFVVVAYLIYSLVMKSINAPKETTIIPVITDTTNKKESRTNQPNLTIQLEILNGTSQSGVASIFTDFLRKQGFDVVDYGNYQSTDEPKTLIIDRSGNSSKCKKIAGILGISEKQIIQQLNSTLYVDATVVIGKDFKELKPFQ